MTNMEDDLMHKVIVFLTDSTCDLSKDLVEQNDIHVFPSYVVFGTTPL